MDTRHPGLIIQQELDKRGRSQKDFAYLLGKRVSETNELIRGKRNVTIQRDMLLGAIFDTPSKKRLLQQMDYDYSISKQSVDMQKLAEIKVRKQLFDEEHSRQEYPEDASQEAVSSEESRQDDLSSSTDQEALSSIPQKEIQDTATNTIASPEESPILSATPVDHVTHGLSQEEKSNKRQDHEIFRNF